MNQIPSFHIKTPLILSDVLTNHFNGIPIYLKLDALQPSGSFKIRGVGHYCAKNVVDGYTHLICSSGGNAGLAAAFSGCMLKTKTTIIIPESAPKFMITKIENEGKKYNCEVNVKVHGKMWSEADELARQLVAQDPQKNLYVPPFDHPFIWTGNSTVIDEIVEQMSHTAHKKPGIVLLSVGGGGLLCGVIEGLHRVGWADVPVMAIETEGANKLAMSIAAGKVITLPTITSIAKTLGANRINAEAWNWLQKHKVISKVVTDKAAVNAAINFGFQDHHILVEPACGAALAPVYEKDTTLSSYSSILVIVCGGSVFEPHSFEEWQQKYNN